MDPHHVDCFLHRHRNLTNPTLNIENFIQEIQTMTITIRFKNLKLLYVNRRLLFCGSQILLTQNPPRIHTMFTFFSIASTILQTQPSTSNIFIQEIHDHNRNVKKISCFVHPNFRDIIGARGK